MAPWWANHTSRQRRPRFDRHAPAVFAKARKEGRGREWIKRRASPRVVFSKIAQHIRERVTRGARGRQRAPVPSVGPETASSKDEAVHPPRDPDRQPSHSSGERVLVGGLDEQMQMIRLHREVHDAKDRLVALVGLGDGPFQSRKDESRSQRPKPRAQRHVHRVAERVLGASTMRCHPSRARLAPGSFSLAAPLAAKRKLQLASLTKRHECQNLCSPARPSPAAMFVRNV